MPIKLVISGCCGRMGQAIARCALADSAFVIGAALEADVHQAVGQDYGTVLGLSSPLNIRVTQMAKEVMGAGDVVIEFTTPDVTVAHAQLAQQLRKPMVIGTTGLSDAQQAMVREAAQMIPIVFSPNMSVGVNVLFELARLAAQRLGPSYDVEVVEAHHRHKQDAPSGTAKRLAEELAASRGQAPASIPVHPIRAGDIVGDHTVILAGPSERLELVHRAHTRDVFARGALRAAKFVSAKPPGLYDMSHVLKANGSG
ncbi:MAG: 4-hydroxy-tetrahydrodipicolinate reductase [Candidatus Omnitrophica bacterium]|nr:4-hydroxy-tetrahydrodipicolinate reductase [Candidatus Omnitrophota bacterium]